LAKLTDELQLNAGLMQRSKGIFFGDTNSQARMTKARHIIKEYALANEKWMGQTYAWWFARCYSVEL
jgi:hypothetical protein